MGLAIIFYFVDGSYHCVSMCYSSFSGKVMQPFEMRKFGFSDHSGVYTGIQLEFLIFRLLESGYLKENFTSQPIRAEFY